MGHWPQHETSGYVTLRSLSSCVSSNVVSVYFQLPRRDGPELKVVPGDELLLRYPGDGARGPWECRGQVTQITLNEEIVLELKSKKDAPTDQTFGFSVDFVWKPTSFERMHMALKRFVVDEYSLTGYLFHLILGHDVEPQTVRGAALPTDFSAPNIPNLNPSQTAAVKEVLQKPLSLIQVCFRWCLALAYR